MGDSRDNDSPNSIVFLIALLVAPLTAVMIQLAVSRAREHEHESDATDAYLKGSLTGTINALTK
jgi:hypothetical protein